jgi:hypothetical protein
MGITSNTRKDVVLGAILPNRSAASDYRKQLNKLLANMAASYEHWLSRAYVRALDGEQDKGTITAPDAVQAEYAADAKKPGKTTAALFLELKRLDGYWSKRFAAIGKDIATYTIEKWLQQNTISWQSKLKRKGFDVKLQLSARQKTLLKVKIHENVSLIKTIQKQYHSDVEGIVSRGFLAGRDLASIAQALRKRHDVSVNRAAFIARDQANKATAQMNAARQDELGISRAIWVHSSAGKEPRPQHVKAGRERWEFDVRVGIDFGDGFGYVLPGEAINCRCSSKSIIPALNRLGGGVYTLADVGNVKGVLEPLKKTNT